MTLSHARTTAEAAAQARQRGVPDPAPGVHDRCGTSEGGRTRDRSLRVLDALLLDRVPREPGVGGFIGMDGEIDVNAFVRFLATRKCLPQTVLFVTTEVEFVPTIPLEQRVHIAELGQGILRVVVRLGFNDEPDIPRALRGAPQLGIDEATMRYYIRKDSIERRPPRGIARWRSWLLRAMSKASRPAWEHLRLPTNRVTQVPMG